MTLLYYMYYNTSNIINYYDCEILYINVIKQSYDIGVLHVLEYLTFYKLIRL